MLDAERGQCSEPEHARASANSTSFAGRIEFPTGTGSAGIRESEVLQERRLICYRVRGKSRLCAIIIDDGNATASPGTVSRIATW
jgi:hypothetical protein